MSRKRMWIDDDLLDGLREKAAREDRPLRDVVEELLRRGLANTEVRKDYRLELEGWEAQPRPGVDILDRGRLLDLLASG